MNTPLEDLKKISSYYKIDLKVKRDDLYPFTGGGNKARKMEFIVRDAEKERANAFVSTGSKNSNHARVVAFTGAKKQWPVHIIIHDKEDYLNGNIQLMKMAGAKLTFVGKENVAEAMDKAMIDFKKAGFNPYYIMGGGHTLPGMLGYYEAVTEFLNQSEGWHPDYVIHASGTGGTQAGLHVGFNEHLPDCRIFGISIARDKERGHREIQKSISELCNCLDFKHSRDQIFFFDEWSGGGYEKSYPALDRSIKKAAKMDGLITDPTYTGKAITALFDMCENEIIKKGSHVLFWHTGGFVNLLTQKENG